MFLVGKDLNTFRADGKKARKSEEGEKRGARTQSRGRVIGVRVGVKRHPPPSWQERILKDK